MEFNEKTHRVCSCCGKAKPKNSFYLNLSQSKEEVSICKTCCFEKYKSLYQITKNIGASLCAVIYQLNLPMLDDVWQITEKEYKLSNHSGQTNIVNIYYKKLLPRINMFISRPYRAGQNRGAECSKHRIYRHISVSKPEAI